MATLAAHQPASVRPTHWKEDNPSNADLAHIPGETGLPIIGNTFKMLADPPAFTRARNTGVCTRTMPLAARSWRW